MNGEDDKLLTVAEAAEEARLSTSSIYEACEKKVLAHHRLSGGRRRGKLLIRRSDLLKWIGSCRVEATGGQQMPPAPLNHLTPPSGRKTGRAPC